MTPNLRYFLTANYGQFPEEDGQKLLLYAAFVQCFCRQYRVPYDRCGPLEGLLPQLFRRVVGYEAKDAASTLDAAMPWGLLQTNPQLADALERLRRRIDRSSCATPQWLREQVEELFTLDSAASGVAVTPPSVRALIAGLAAQRPARQVVDLCSGTFLLGLQVWEALGADPWVSCRGEELSAYLCAISRLLLFLSGVEDFSIRERNVADVPDEAGDQAVPSRIYVADFPLAGNRTYSADPDDPFLKEQKASLYADWLLIRSALNRMRTGDRAFLIVTKGALVRQNERSLREHLVRNDWLDAVVQLPAGLCPDHNLPLELLICEKGRSGERRGQVLFADLSPFSTPGTRRARTLSQEGISKLCGVFQRFCGEEGLSKAAPVQDIQEAEYSLYPPVYLAASQTFTTQICLKEAAEVIRGLQLPKGCFAAEDGPRYLLNVRDLQDGEIHYEDAERIEVGNPLWEGRYRIREDDIILTSKGSALKMAIVPPDPPAAYISGNLTLLRVNPERYPPYVLYEYLASESGRLALSLIQTGTTIRVLGSGNLGRLKVPAYDRALAGEIGLALKCAALRYRQSLIRLNENYDNQKKVLLSQLNQREETKK